MQSISRSICESYSSACLLIPVSPEAAQLVSGLRYQLQPYLAPKDEEHAFSPHVTVFYGFDDTDFRTVQLITEETPPPFVLVSSQIGFFSLQDAFVVYATVHSPDLQQLHERLRQAVGKDSTHEPYTAHCTVAYTDVQYEQEIRRLCEQYTTAPASFFASKAYFGYTNEIQIPLFFLTKNLTTFSA